MSNATCELYGDVLVVTLKGRIDRKTSAQLEPELVEWLGSANRAVCDLADVSEISSTGYRLLLRLYYEVSARQGEIALIGPSQEVRDTLSATGLQEFFVMASTLDGALARLCEKSAGHASLG
jgi:anti-sigma B factor antagonist